MLAHFQEEAAGRTHGVDGDETTITTIPNTIMSVTPSLFFSSFLTHRYGACLVGLRCILTFFCNFCLIPNSFLPCFVVGLCFFGILFRLCVIFYTLLSSFLLFSSSAVGFFFRFSYPVVSFARFLVLHINYSSISHSYYCYHTVCFFITLLFVFYVFSLFFCFALANMGRVYSLILQRGEWERF